jgi:hypothetical protein
MMARYYVEVLVVYSVETDSLGDAVERASNMVVGETPPVVEKLVPTGRYVVKQ